MTEQRVKYIPPTFEVLQEIAKRAAQAVGRPDTAMELASFLEVAARMKAAALNKQQSSLQQGKVEN